MPRRAVEDSPHYEPAMRGTPVRRWIGFMGLDVVRSPDGRFAVIEDQVRMPSGLAYAVAARETLGDVLPLRPPQADLSEAYDELASVLREAAPPGAPDEPRMVLLCEGREAAAWWEHDLLGRELGAPAVTLADVERRGNRLIAWVDGRPQGVDVVYQRTDEDRFTGPDGRLTAVGEALLEPCRAGTLACVNAPGSGVADDKVVHAHVDRLVRELLGEEPLLPSVPSFDLGEKEERETALERLESLVIKPRGEMGGEDVVLWREAGEDTRRATLAAVRAGAGRLGRSGAGDPLGAPHRLWSGARAQARGPATVRAGLRPRGGRGRRAQPRGTGEGLDARQQRQGRRSQGHLAPGVAGRAIRAEARPGCARCPPCAHA